MPPDRLVPVTGIPMQTATMCELLSVAIHAINRLDKIAHQYRDTIGIWGDGSVAYVIACALKRRCRKAK